MLSPFVYTCFFLVLSTQDPHSAFVTKYPLLLKKTMGRPANIEASVTQKGTTVLFDGHLYFQKLSEQENT